MLSIQSIDGFFVFLLVFPYRKANNRMIVCGVLKSFSTFALCLLIGKHRHCGKGVYLTLWFWLCRTSQTLKICQKQSNGECLIGCVSVHLCYINRDDWYNYKVTYIHICVRLPLLVSTNRAMRRPYRVKRATSVGFTLSFYSYAWVAV